MKTLKEITLTWAPGTTEVYLNEGSKVLHADYNRGTISLAIESDESKEPVLYEFRPFAVGDVVPDDMTYVATIREPGSMLHIYQKIHPAE